MTKLTDLSPIETDRVWMQRALALARQGLGRTSPNPMVGAVVVQAGESVGEGFHPKAGEPHAEVFALRAAGDRAQGATLYVNLEPCNHYGRTPPCSEAVIRAGIGRVVVGMVDPDPRVAGGGIARLKAAGIAVTVGIEEADCQQLNEAFVHRVRYQRPFGILKYAMTLDGKIATPTGHSAWVSGPESRAQVHQLRAECDAVIVGGNTVRRDNPLLTSHGRGDRDPLRVVMSRQLDLPREAQLWRTDQVPTLVLTETSADPTMQDALATLGVKIAAFPKLTPEAAMSYLYDLGISRVLWECGGTLAAAAIAAAAVQKVCAFIAPKLIGGVGAPSPVGELGLLKMSDALPLSRVSWQTVGNDLRVDAYLNSPNPKQTAQTSLTSEP
ncbi:MAG: bifunctional diaminohydroxyphosphoribosylaminopyrimidine deaminase/5-amino-6-(5-phosphoribosylamino)uracil reductase RibD [Cyanobacteria bacterium P01_A01_bin.123]